MTCKYWTANGKQWKKLVVYIKENSVDCDLRVGKSVRSFSRFFRMLPYCPLYISDPSKQSDEIFKALVAAGGKTDADLLIDFAL